MRVTGTVKFFNSGKGFGYIQPDDGGKDGFVHATAVEAAGMRALNEGDRVSFELRTTGKAAASRRGSSRRRNTEQTNPPADCSTGGGNHLVTLSPKATRDRQ
jgi:cold shock protein